MTTSKRSRSAVTGQFVGSAEAEANPRETVTEMVRSRSRCWCGGESRLEEYRGWVCAESEFHDPEATGHKERIEKLYIAGPMSGIEDCNYPAFNEAELELHRAGFYVRNPARISAGQRAHYVDYLREDLRALLDCDGVAVLPGWEFSTGARNEVNVGGLLKMPVKTVGEWLESRSREL